MTDPTHVEQLAPLDLPMPKTYIRVLLGFEQAGPALQIIQNLQSGLDRLSRQIPWLSGRVFSTPSAQDSASSLEIRWNTNNVPNLLDKGTISTSYECALSREISTEAIPSDVWPVSSMPDDSATGAPIFAASSFRFADQGVGLCVCVHHSVTDGTGLSEIMRLWAKNVTDPGSSFSDSPQGRSERLSEALSSDLQKTSSISSEGLFALHPEYSHLPPSLPDKFPSCTSKLFTISMHWIGTLKELMRKYTLKKPTTNTVISALIWSTITRVRLQDNPSLGSEMSHLGMAVNGRQRISETSSPESPYFGNAVLYSLSKYPAGALAASDEAPVRSLAELCDHIAQSQAPSVINSRHIAEVCHLIDRIGDRGSLFVGWDLFGSRDLTITNWADLELYGVDFGDVLGKPKLVRLPYMEADGVAIILPRQRAVSPEVLEVMIMLRRDHIEALERDPMWPTLLSGGGGDGEMRC